MDIMECASRKIIINVKYAHVRPMQTKDKNKIVK